MKTNLKSLVLVAVLSTGLPLLAFGCGNSPPAAPDSGMDGDTDTDSDSDSDTDTDSDSDSDSDSDTGIPDGDGDGLADDFEDELGTDPEDEDSDGDGASDLVEWVAGTDPLDPEDNPANNGDFYFLMPFQDDPDPEVGTLAFGSELGRADLYILMDTSGSMGTPITELQAAMTDTIVAGAAALIPDLWFGLGNFEDYPVSPHGAVDNVPFALAQRTTDDAAALQTAVDTLVAYNGGDYPESQVPALWATATGGALEGYVEAQDACVGTEVGYPCFRRGALPIIVMVTDNEFHNDYDDNAPYTVIDPPAPTWDETLAALRGIHAKVPSVFLDNGSVAAGEADCNQLALETGTVDADDAPITLSEGASWATLGESIVSLVTSVTVDVPYGQVTATAFDDDADEVDAVAAFIERIEADEDGGEEDPDNPGVFCLGGLATTDLGDDGHPDAFVGLLPGTTICFDVVPKTNETVDEQPEPMVYPALIDVIADEVTLLDSRTVLFLVPPSPPITE
ncbi:MAG: VWA domain-containing protein [Deltaproteobacteria bacterium]|nr:VWA domain-containing protein [Deltaproteobacteria bacterium]